MKRLLRFLSCFLPVKRIFVDGELYLERFYLFGPDTGPTYGLGKPRLRFLPTVWLHCFHAPDGDRELHNHPWDISKALILTGGYREARKYGPFLHYHTYKPWEINVIDRDTFHRITRLLEPEVWTLFCPGKRLDRWGFLNAQGEFRYHDQAADKSSIEGSGRSDG